MHYSANLTTEQLGDACWFCASRLAAQGKGLWEGSCSLHIWAPHRQRGGSVTRDPVLAVVPLRTSFYIKKKPNRTAS